MYCKKEDSCVEQCRECAESQKLIDFADQASKPIVTQENVNAIADMLGIEKDTPMDSKAEALEIFNSFYDTKDEYAGYLSTTTCKYFSKVFVDRIIKTAYWKDWDEGEAQYEFGYWQEVKKNIDDIQNGGTY